MTVDGDTQITAVGVAPNDGGDTITSYDWRYRTTSPLGNWVDRLDQTILTQVFSGLDPEQGYRFQFRATNSVGDSAYSPNANATTDATPTTLTAPVFSDDMGNAQTWARGEAITPVTVPAASGSPTPTYAVVGALPAGINFDAANRALSGTPTAIGTGTITIRATNSEGVDDWTVAYTTLEGGDPLMAYVNPTDVTAGQADDIAVYQRIVDNQRVFFEVAQGITVTLYSADKVLVGDGSGDGSIESFTVPDGHILIGGAGGVLDTLAPSLVDGDLLTSRNGALAWETP